jgi:hypothetical protein
MYKWQEFDSLENGNEWGWKHAWCLHDMQTPSSWVMLMTNGQYWIMQESSTAVFTINETSIGPFPDLDSAKAAYVLLNH